MFRQAWKAKADPKAAVAAIRASPYGWIIGDRVSQAELERAVKTGGGIQWYSPKEDEITVTGDKKNVVDTAAFDGYQSPLQEEVADVVKGFGVSGVVKSGYGLAGTGAAILDNLGITDEALYNVKKSEKDTFSEMGDVYHDPNGPSRAIGEFLGEAAPYIAAYAASKGALGAEFADSVIGQGLVEGATSAAFSGGEDVLEQTLLGAGLGMALPAAIDGASAAVRAIGKKGYRPDLPVAGPTTKEATPEPDWWGMDQPKEVTPPVVKTKHTPESVRAEVDEAVKTWKNSPAFNVVRDARSLPKAVQEQLRRDQAFGAQAFTDADGKIHVLTKNLPDGFSIPALAYHEALGHVGLSRFQKDVDSLLQGFHDSNWRFREETKKWLDKNPKAYLNDKNRLLRAAEEVLAEQSEKGVIDPSLWSRLKAYIRAKGRELGLDLRYSDNDIKNILSQAHQTVTGKTGSFTGSSGNRYMYIGSKGGEVEDSTGWPTWSDEQFSAIERAEAGEDSGPGSQIHKDTGWFVGPDRKWRKEISDADASFREGINLKDFTNDSGIEDAAKAIKSDFSFRKGQAASQEDYGLYARAETLVNSFLDHVSETGKIPVPEEMLKAIGLGDRFSPGNVWDRAASLVLKNIEDYGVGRIRAATKLSDILDHPELFKAYPKAADINIQHTSGWDDFGGIKGWFDEDKNTIALSRRLTEPMTTLLHEVQHYVQGVEGFARGGSPERSLGLFDNTKLLQLTEKLHGYLSKLHESLSNKRDAYKFIKTSPVVEDIRKAAHLELYGKTPEVRVAARAEMTRLEEDLSKTLGYSNLTKFQKSKDYNTFKWLLRDPRRLEDGITDSDKAINEIVDQANDIVEALNKDGSIKDKEALVKALGKNKDLSFQAYEHLFGEVEARDTANRIGLDSKARAETTPYTSEDFIEPSDYAFDVRPSQNRYMNRQEESPLIRDDINLEDFGSEEELDDYMKRVISAVPKGSVSDKELFARAEANGLPVSKALKALAKVHPERAMVLVDSYEKAMAKATDAVRRYREGGETAKDRENFQKFVADAAVLAAKINGYSSELGRALRAQRFISDARKNMKMSELSRVEIGALGDQRYLNTVMDLFDQNGANPRGQSKLILDSVQPLWEDTITQAHYALMLSGLSTQVKNAVGNASMVGLETLAHTVAAGLGKVRGLAYRMTGVEKPGDFSSVSTREAFSRWWGLVTAFEDGQIWKDAAQSWREGQPAHKVNKTEMGQAMPGLWGYPQRGLATMDSFFRTIIEHAELKGLAMRKALAEGKTGAKLADRVDELLYRATPDMLKQADQKAEVLQLISESGPIGKALERLKSRPDKPFTPAGRQARIWRFAAQNLLQFTRVAGNLMRTGIRWSPVGAFERYGAEAWAKGGADRDIQLSRMLIGTAIGGWFWQEIDKGNISVDPLTMVVSLKTKAGEVSLAGLDAMSTIGATVFGMKEALKKGEEKEYGAAVQSFIHGLVSSMASSSFGDQMNAVFSAVGKGPQGETALRRLVKSTATSFYPAIVRQYNQSMPEEMGGDPSYRDTSNDGTLGGEITDSLISAVPGLSKTLPQRHDEFGRPQMRHQNMTGLMQTKPLETDPVVLEIQRLTKSSGKPIIGRARASDIKEAQAKAQGVEEEEITPDSAVTQNYQVSSGQNLLENLRGLIESPEYKDMSDKDQIKAIRDLAKDVRKQVRDEMFSGEVTYKEGW